MQTVTLVRFKHVDEGTLGKLTLPNDEQLFTVEPPWADNQKGKSCIPTGTYTVKRDRTGRFQYFAVRDVPERTAIEIHPANYFINPGTGRQELHGCIAPGLSLNTAHPASVNSSRAACNKLLEVMGEEDWLLEIVNSEDVLMQTVTLVRFKHVDEGTLGKLTLPNDEQLFTVEPPWADNQKGKSCIPTGTYTVKRDRTGRFQYFAVRDVPERTAIEIHPANYFINPGTGRQELHGCIAPGLSLNAAHPASVNSSRAACNKLLEVMGEEDWLLEIVNSEDR